MKQEIKQNGVVYLVSPDNASCNMIFRNLTGENDIENHEAYLRMMFHNFPGFTYGEVELWQDGVLLDKGEIKKRQG